MTHRLAAFNLCGCVVECGNVAGETLADVVGVEDGVLGA